MIIDSKRFAVTTRLAEKESEAQQLAKQLGLVFIPSTHRAGSYEYFLVLESNYLGLQKASETKWNPFHIDFQTGKMHYRIQKASLKKELLARALGEKPKNHPRIVDATAGLGRDSFILASLGFEIQMMEASPILYLLLQDGLKRASLSSETQAAASRLQLIFGDAIDVLPSLPEKPDIIYLDPMFPERKKSASVKKEMVTLQELLGKCENEDELFEVAFACTRKRLVVKRPLKAAQISKERKPSFSLMGKTSRFDIYLIN